MFKKKIKQHVLLKQLELLQNSSVPGSLLVAVVSSEALRWTIKAKFPLCLQGGCVHPPEEEGEGSVLTTS